MHLLTTKSFIGLFGLFFTFAQLTTAQDFSQKSSTIGLIGGIELGPLSWKSDDLDFVNYVNGLGIRAQLRYGINEFFSVNMHYLQSFNLTDYSGGEDFSVNAFQFGGRFHLMETASQWRPFLGASLSYSTSNPELVIIDSGIQGISSIKGLGIGLEGGGHYFFNPRTSLNFSANLVRGNYTNVVVAGQELTEDLNYTILYFALGFNYQLVP